MRFKKMVTQDPAELSLAIVETLRPLLHLFLKSHAPRRTHYISHEPTQPRARPEPRSYCIRFHRLVYGFPRRTLLETVKSIWSGESTANLWVYHGQDIVLLPRFADSQSLTLRPIRTFRTVSLGSPVNKASHRSATVGPVG